MGPFTRIWCAFEESMAIQHLNLLLDIAAFDSSQAHLLTDGKTPGDVEEGKKMWPGAENKVKVERERQFPLDIIENGLTVNLELAQATHADDRLHILNSLVGR